MSGKCGKTRNAYSLSVWKTEEEAPLGCPRHRWVDNIKMDHKSRMRRRELD
jgi:hypothetical protein